METNRENPMPAESSHPTCSAQASKQQTERHCCFHGSPTWTAFSTESQERLPPPFRSQTFFSMCKSDPKQQGKERDDTVAVFRSLEIPHSWMKNRHHVCRSDPTIDLKRQDCDPYDAESSEQNFETTYERDYKVWKLKRQEPFNQKEHFKVPYGLNLAGEAYKDMDKGSPPVSKSVSTVPKPPPIETVTSYRAYYIPHGVQPRRPSMKPQHKPVASQRARASKSANNRNKDAPNGSGGSFQCKALAFETNFPCCQEELVQSSCPCDKTLPSMEPDAKMFQAMSLIQDGCRVWDAPPCCTSARKEATGHRMSNRTGRRNQDVPVKLSERRNKA